MYFDGFQTQISCFNDCFTDFQTHTSIEFGAEKKKTSRCQEMEKQRKLAYMILSRKKS